MSDTCLPSLIVIGTAINHLETKVSLKTICCLTLFVVVYKCFRIKGNGGKHMYTKSRCHRYHC